MAIKSQAVHVAGFLALAAAVIAALYFWNKPKVKPVPVNTSKALAPVGTVAPAVAVSVRGTGDAVNATTPSIYTPNAPSTSDFGPPPVSSIVPDPDADVL